MYEIKEKMLDLKLEQSHDQMKIIKNTIEQIDHYLLKECSKNNVVYRVHERLHEIGMIPYFDDINFRRYIGEDLDKTEFLSRIWMIIAYRMDLVYSYRAYLGSYKTTIKNIKEIRDEEK